MHAILLYTWGGEGGGQGEGGSRMADEEVANLDNVLCMHMLHGAAVI